MLQGINFAVSSDSCICAALYGIIQVSFPKAKMENNNQDHHDSWSDFWATFYNGINTCIAKHTIINNKYHNVPVSTILMEEILHQLIGSLSHY